MSRADRHKNKKSVFWKAYFVYLAIIAVAFIAVFLYVRSTMLEYERNSSDNYSIWLVSDVSETSELGKYLEENNFSDTRYGDAVSRKTDFYNKAKNTVLEAVTAKTGHSSQRPVYDITADGLPFITIALREEGSTTKLGIMTLSDWVIDYAIVRNPYSDGITVSDDNNLDYILSAPSDFIPVIDGEQIKLEPSGETDLDDFKYLTSFVDTPKAYTYELSDLYYEPTFSVLNNGSEEIELEQNSNGVYSASAEYAASPEAKELADSICNPLEIGKLWSKFMTDDVGGASHGLATVRSDCRLLNGTNLYDLATRWASNVDITFVSGHSLDGFSKESVTNYVMYNDKLLSCDVYFEKNMTLMRGMGPRTDVFSNRMFFGNVNGNWYLLDMVSLEY